MLFFVHQRFPGAQSEGNSLLFRFRMEFSIYRRQGGRNTQSAADLHGKNIPFRFGAAAVADLTGGIAPAVGQTVFRNRKNIYRHPLENLLTGG